MGSESLVHVFLVSFPGQGHVNPLLRLGKRLASMGLLVTFTAPEGIGKDMRKASNITDEPTPVGDGFIRYCLPIKAVGPLFKNPKVAGAGSGAVKGDFMKADDGIMGWLDTKEVGSVVYISFGSVVYLKQEQVNEIAEGILRARVSFLWVMRPPHKDSGFELVVLPEGFLEKAGDKGKVVQWSPQEQVLAHPSVACFVTHCGWNSTMEALTSGMPVVAVPQWGDQVTDAKYLVDVFKVGIRMCRGEADDRVIPRDEVEKYLRDATSGPAAAEMKANALKWKKATEDAVAEGGSSDRNMQEFVAEVRRRSL